MPPKSFTKEWTGIKPGFVLTRVQINWSTRRVRETWKADKSFKQDMSAPTKKLPDKKDLKSKSSAAAKKLPDKKDANSKSLATAKKFVDKKKPKKVSAKKKSS